MSGYFTVLIYEYAAAGLEKSAQTAATRLLNICFQVLFYTNLFFSCHQFVIYFSSSTFFLSPSFWHGLIFFSSNILDRLIFVGWYTPFALIFSVHFFYPIYLEFVESTLVHKSVLFYTDIYIFFKMYFFLHRLLAFLPSS